MIFDIRNNRLWFITTHVSRELGDAIESSGIEKQHYINQRFASRVNVLEKRTLRRQTRYYMEQEKNKLKKKKRRSSSSTFLHAVGIIVEEKEGKEGKEGKEKEELDTVCF